MKSNLKPIVATILMMVTLSLQGCAAYAVADATVSSTVFVAKTAVKGTVGAGKLVYRGGKAAAGALSNNEQTYSAANPPALNGGNAPSCYNADGSYTPALQSSDGTFFCP